MALPKPAKLQVGVFFYVFLVKSSPLIGFYHFVFILPVAQMFAQRYGLARLSIGGVLRMMLDTHEHTDLGVEIKNHLNQGDVVPDELAIQALEVVLMCAVYNFQG